MIVYKEPDEWGRMCQVCDGLKRTDEFVHDVCRDCHDYDMSQCELCQPEAVR